MPHNQPLWRAGHPSRHALLWIICFLTLLGVSEAGPQLTSASDVAAASDQLQVSVTPLVIPTDGSLTLTVKKSDGTPYSGQLDQDQLFCPLGVIDDDACKVQHGAWGDYVVNNGTLSVNVEDSDSDGTPMPNGMYIVRFRPHGSSDTYSNQIAYFVDRSARPVSETSLYNSGKYSLPKPVEGAYTIYQDVAPDGTLNGYTKVEYEHGVCEGSGIVQRFTKTSANAYWNASGNPSDTTISNLRWCIGLSETNPANFKAISSAFYAYNRTITSTSSLASTVYSDTLLGNLGRLGADTRPDPTMRFGRMPRITMRDQTGQDQHGTQPDGTIEGFQPMGSSPLFYTLAPVNLFPEVITNTFVPVIDRLINYDVKGETINNWHVEVRASLLGGLYEVRYIEWAIRVANLSASSDRASTPSKSVDDWNLLYRWNVLEDWDWNRDGTLNRITQQGNNHAFVTPDPEDLPIDCWLSKAGCDSPVKHTLNRISTYTPDGQALAIQFVDNFGSQLSILTTSPNQPCRMIVRTADGRPYDGFLQLSVASGTPPVWVDAKKYPIYISNGAVELLPSAFASQPDGVLSFKVRQQLLNEDIASDIVLDSLSQPATESQPFSNEIYLVQAHD